jgi:putative transposase
MRTYALCNQPVLLRSIEPGQYTSWAFGQRLRHTGLLGSMGSVGDALDNAVAESFFATLQTELLDRHLRTHRQQLATAIFEWIEVFYNQQRRHSTLDMLDPVTYHQTRHSTPATDPDHHTQGDRRTGGTPLRA